MNIRVDASIDVRGRDLHRCAAFSELRAAMLIALAAVAIRVAIVIARGGRDVETFEYEMIAEHLLAGKGFGLELYDTWYRTFGSPPFSFLLAGVYWLVGHAPQAMLAVQAVCSGITVLACYGLGRRLFSPYVGIWAAAMAGVHPALVFYDTHKIHPLSLDACLAAVGLLLVLMMRNRDSLKAAAWTGAVHGLAVFERTTQCGLGLLAVAALWRRHRRRDSCRRLAVYLAAGLAVISPWVIRNIRVYGRPVLVTTTGAEVFWRGNNPVASGGAYADHQPGTPVFSAAPVVFQAQVIGHDELAQRAAFSREAWAYIRQHPVRAWRLYLKKLGIFWWFSSQSGFLYPSAYLTLYRVYYAVLLVLAVIGMSTILGEGSAEQRWARKIVWLFVLSVALLQAAFYVEIRHRWGIEPLLIVFAAGGTAWLGRRLGHRSLTDVRPASETAMAPPRETAQVMGADDV